MRCIRIASSYLLACLSLILFLHTGSTVRVSAANPSTNVIRVWTVGSPHTNALPPAVVTPELRQRAESLGYTIQVETFRAGGFTDKFREALQTHNEPEILTFDNYGVISGIQTQKAWVEGLYPGSRVAWSLALVHETLSSLQRQGWVMLVRSAVNYEAALALAMPPAQCELQSGVVDSPSIESPLRQAQEKAVFATRAYLDCDRSTLAGISDESRLVQQCYLPKSDMKVQSVNACRVSGNDKLAFVTLVSTFTAEVREPDTASRSKQGMDLGQQSIAAVLRNQNGTWRLLAITHDPPKTLIRIPVTTNTNDFGNLLDQAQPTGITPDAARLLMPDGLFPVPKKGERFGDFIWQPSPSSDVIGQAVEFSLGKDTNWGFTRLFFLPPNENKLSSGLLMGGGTSAWRVWSISKAGDVAFSEQHSFKY